MARTMARVGPVPAPSALVYRQRRGVAQHRACTHTIVRITQQFHYARFTNLPRKLTKTVRVVTHTHPHTHARAHAHRHGSDSSPVLPRTRRLHLFLMQPDVLRQQRREPAMRRLRQAVLEHEVRRQS